MVGGGLDYVSMDSLLEVSNGASHVPAFLAKLWKIVDDENTNDLICWSEMGNSFLIRNQSKFARELLPLYYKHNNMASFVRQLNMYGFHKVVSVEQGGLRTDKDEMEFAHPFFLRGSESTLELIKRKIPAAKLDEPHGSRPDTINKVLLDVRQMKGRQDNMDSKLMKVKRENEALWRELSLLRQKHAKQQQIVSKLLQFLVGMMSSQSHRIGFKRRMHMNVPLMLNDSDGLQANKRTKNSGAELSGPVIRDVTDYVNSSARLLDDDSSDYGIIHTSDIEPIDPQVESPHSVEHSPDPQDPQDPQDSVYPMSSYEDPDMLLSVDPSTINPSVNIKPSTSTSIISTVPKLTVSKKQIGRQDLDGHLDDVQVGLDNLRELLKQDQYSIDSNTLFSLFDSDSEILSLPSLDVDLQDKEGTDNNSTPAGEGGMDMVAYNPSLYELTDDDTHYFDYQNSEEILGDTPRSLDN